MSAKRRGATPPLDAPSSNSAVAPAVAAVTPIRALLTVDHMAELFGRSRAAIYRKVQEGHLPPPRNVGGCSRWLGSEIAELIANAEAGK